MVCAKRLTLSVSFGNTEGMIFLDMLSRRGYKAWIAGMRRDQTLQRACIPVAGWDESFRVVDTAPLAFRNGDQGGGVCGENRVPLNPLLKKGYRSLGCEPCTGPVAPREAVRAGRWPDLEKTECMLHITQGTVYRVEC